MPLPVHWESYRRPFLSIATCEAIERKLNKELDEWLDTPYLAGSSAKGPQGGVDCIRFVCSVLDAMYGYQREPLDRLPGDVAMHDPARARAALRKMLRNYEPNIRVDDGTIEPGDILVVSPERGGPSHAKIVSATPNKIYHATTNGIRFTGILERVGSPWAVYRVLDKEKWAA